MIEKYFQFKEKKTNYKTEITAGVTTFLSVFYIIFVNPQILQEANIPYEAAFAATIFASAIATLLVGLYANLPFTLIPGMGINATFTYTAVLGLGFTYQEALFGIFVSGCIFFLLSITNIRSMITKTIPNVLKSAVSVGIGFFIAFVGCKNAGIIIANESTFVTLGDFTKPIIIITILALFSCIICVMKNKPIGVFYTMIATIFIILICQFMLNIDLGLKDFVWTPVTELNLSQTLFSCFNVDIIKLFTNMNFWIIVFSFLFVDFFDTTGMLVTLGKKVNLIQKDGSIKNEKKLMLVDSGSTIIGSMLGTSSVTTSMESMAGITVGGKTGFSSVITAICFLLSLFIFPIFQFLQPVMNAFTTPALVLVGIMMIEHISEIDFTKIKNAAIAFLTIFFTISSYSIAEGIAIGIITYVICSLFDKTYKEISPIMYILCIFFFIHYIFM